MKISIAIPTRSRAFFLKSCLSSVLIAARNADCEVEVIVSDNASSDNTASVVESFNAPEIVYTRLEHRVSMRGNFENALSQCAGDYIIFIGDDDGIVPSGLRLLENLIKTHDVDILNWRLVNYNWPNPEIGQPGNIALRWAKLAGNLRHLDSEKLNRAFMAGVTTGYKQGGNIYHGCISRQLIDRVKSKTGAPYFRGSSPDVYASLINMVVVETPILHINRIITFGGSSPRSNGDSAQSMPGAAPSEYKKFLAESSDDPWRADISDHCVSLQLHTFEIYRMCCNLLKIPFQPNIRKWEKHVLAELSQFSSEKLDTCRDTFERVFGHSLTLTGTICPDIPPKSDEHLMTTGFIRQNKVSKTIISGGFAMQNVHQAGHFLDKIHMNSPILTRSVFMLAYLLKSRSCIRQLEDTRVP